MNMKYVIVLVIAIAANAEGQEYYTVGEDIGWTIPPSLDYYAQWAAKYDIVQPDVLVFNYEKGASDVALLASKEDFDTCNTTNPIFVDPNLWYFGSFQGNVTYYFTTTFADYCSKGQKVTVYYGLSAAADQTQASQPLKLVSEKMGTSGKVSVTVA